MGVRDAVEKVEQEQPETPVHVLVREAIARQASVLNAVLPDFMSAERFEQVTLATVKATPGLVKCWATLEGRTSVLFGIIQAASVGLEIGGVAQECWLIPRTRRVFDERTRKWRDGPTEATFQLGYRGVQKLARRDPSVGQILGDVVREGDEFEHWRDLNGDHFHHRVVGPTADRELTHAYCLIRYVNGFSLPVVLDRDQVEKRRAVSSSYKAEAKKPEDERSGFWIDWEAEMWAKTAVHASKRHLDLAPDIQRALNADEQAVTREMLTETAARPPVRRPELATMERNPLLRDAPMDQPSDAYDIELDRLAGEPEPDNPDPFPTRDGRDEIPPAYRQTTDGALVTVAELAEMMEGRTTAIVAALQHEFPDRAGELTSPADIHADPEALDRALAIMEQGR